MNHYTLSYNDLIKMVEEIIVQFHSTSMKEAFDYLVSEANTNKF